MLFLWVKISLLAIKKKYFGIKIKDLVSHKQDKFYRTHERTKQSNTYMKGLNKVTLIGNLGNDPSIQNLEGNIKAAKFSLATSESYKDSNGQNQTITDWHNVILWRGLAEIAEKYLHKGSLVYVEGKLKTRNYDDKDGQKKYVTEIIGEQLILLDKKTDGN